MLWRDVEEHYDNVSKAYDVLGLIDNDHLTAKDELREVICRELQLSCRAVIEWLDDSENETSKNALSYLETLQSGYDICVVIETRNFIYKLLDKPLNNAQFNSLLFLLFFFQ